MRTSWHESWACFLLLGRLHSAARAPVIFDTDIGTDIDDAYALAALLQRSDLELLGVTTVSSDAVARARLAAKLLHVAGGKWAAFRCTPAFRRPRNT